MRAFLQLYLQQFKTTFAAMVQYRASLAIWIGGQVLEPLIYLVVWSVVSRARGGSVGDYTTAEFAAYFIVLMLVNHLTYTWIMYEFEYRVQHGSLSFALLRPVHPIHSDIADNASSKVLSFPWMVLTAVVLSLLFHPAFSFAPWTFAAVLPALALSYILRFLLEWTLALAAFWTTRVSAFNQLYFVALLFLSGQIAPLSLFPPWVQSMAAILPFRWMIGFPVELLLGRLSPTQIWTGLGVQVLWIALALGLVRLVWRAGVRVYSAVGA